MVVKEFWVILLGVKKLKVWNKTKEKYMLVRRQNLAETDRGSYYKEEWLKEFLKVIIMIRVILKIINSSSYRREDFANSCYKIVSTFFLQKLINDLPSASTIVEQVYLLKLSATVFETRTRYFKREPHFLKNQPRTWQLFYAMLHKFHIFKLIW